MSNIARIPGARFATLYPKPSRVVESSYRSKVPGHLSITPYPFTLAAVGGHGGPFTPSSQAFTLSNDFGDFSLDWTAAASTADGTAWLNANGLVSTGGTLAPGASVTVTVALNSLYANVLVAGHTYPGSVLFNNETSPMNFFTVIATVQVSNPP